MGLLNTTSFYDDYSSVLRYFLDDLVRNRVGPFKVLSRYKLNNVSWIT